MGQPRKNVMEERGANHWNATWQALMFVSVSVCDLRTTINLKTKIKKWREPAEQPGGTQQGTGRGSPEPATTDPPQPRGLQRQGSSQARVSGRSIRSGSGGLGSIQLSPHLCPLFDKREQRKVLLGNIFRVERMEHSPKKSSSYNENTKK